MEGKHLGGGCFYFAFVLTISCIISGQKLITKLSAKTNNKAQCKTEDFKEVPVDSAKAGVRFPYVEK